MSEQMHEWMNGHVFSRPVLMYKYAIDVVSAFKYVNPC